MELIRGKQNKVKQDSLQADRVIVINKENT